MYQNYYTHNIAFIDVLADGDKDNFDNYFLLPLSHQEEATFLFLK